MYHSVVEKVCVDVQSVWHEYARVIQFTAHLVTLHVSLSLGIIFNNTISLFLSAPLLLFFCIRNHCSSRSCNYLSFPRSRLVIVNNGFQMFDGKTTMLVNRCYTNGKLVIVCSAVKVICTYGRVTTIF